MEQPTILIGRMHNGNVVHIARHVKTTKDGYKLYAPACSGMRRAHVAYLGLIAGDAAAVTCTRCQKRLAQGAGR